MPVSTRTSWVSSDNVSITTSKDHPTKPEKCYVHIKSVPTGTVAVKTDGKTQLSGKEYFRMEGTFTFGLRTTGTVRFLLDTDFSEEPDENERKYNGDLVLTFTRVAGAY